MLLMTAALSMKKVLPKRKSLLTRLNEDLRNSFVGAVFAA